MRHGAAGRAYHGDPLRAFAAALALLAVEGAPGGFRLDAEGSNSVLECLQQRMGFQRMKETYKVEAKVSDRMGFLRSVIY